MPDAPITIREMTIADYDTVMRLWNSAPGVRAAETSDELERMLQRNPGLSGVACCGNELAGAVLCGQDGRRGYLYHLAVADAFRRRGIGRQLVDRCLDRLRDLGIRRCTIFLITDNAHGESFWRETGWRERTDLKAFAKDL